MYRCRYFKIHELVPPQVYKDRGERAWELLDDRLLQQLDLLRDHFGPMTVNNYEFGGDRQWSGLRTTDSPYYSKYSQHSFGRAADCLFKEYSAEQVRAHIISNKHLPEFQFINAVELGTSWLHFDIRNCNRIKMFNP